MSCKIPMEQIHLYMDGELGERDTREMEQHLLSCKICSEQYDGLYRTLQALKSLGRKKAPAGLADHVMAECATETASGGDFNGAPKAAQLYSVSYFKPMAAAAILLVCVMLALPFMMDDKRALDPHGTPDDAREDSQDAQSQPAPGSSEGAAPVVMNVDRTDENKSGKRFAEDALEPLKTLKQENERSGAAPNDVLNADSLGSGSGSDAKGTQGGGASTFGNRDGGMALTDEQAAALPTLQLTCDGADVDAVRADLVKYFASRELPVAEEQVVLRADDAEESTVYRWNAADNDTDERLPKPAEVPGELKGGANAVDAVKELEKAPAHLNEKLKADAESSLAALSKDLTRIDQVKEVALQTAKAERSAYADPANSPASADRYKKEQGSGQTLGEQPKRPEERQANSPGIDPSALEKNGDARVREEDKADANAAESGKTRRKDRSETVRDEANVLKKNGDKETVTGAPEMKSKSDGEAGKKINYASGVKRTGDTFLVHYRGQWVRIRIVPAPVTKK